MPQFKAIEKLIATRSLNWYNKSQRHVILSCLLPSFKKNPKKILMARCASDTHV